MGYREEKMSIRKSMLGFFLIFALFLLFGGAALQECEADQAAGTCPVYRFYNTQTGAHFFTISEGEKDYVIATLPQFRFEGVAWYAHPVGDGCGTPPPTDNARWGAVNAIGCIDGSALTLSVTVDGTTKSSKNQSGNVSWNEYATTSAGSKNVSWTLSGCAPHSSSSSYTFEKDKCYAFFATILSGKFILQQVLVPGCESPPPLNLFQSIEENGDAMDLEESGSTFYYCPDYLDFFDDELEIIEE